MLKSAIMALAAIPAFANPALAAESQFAQSRFKFSRNTPFTIMVQTCNSKGKVRAIQLKVSEGKLDLNSFDVFYAAGGKQRLTGKLSLAKDQVSPWLPIGNVESPCLQKVVLNIAPGRSMTTVHLIGDWQ